MSTNTKILIGSFFFGLASGFVGGLLVMDQSRR